MSPQSTQTGTRHAWEWPACPECESEIFVASSYRGGRGNTDGDFRCFLCDVVFDVSKYERRKYE